MPLATLASDAVLDRSALPDYAPGLLPEPAAYRLTLAELACDYGQPGDALDWLRDDLTLRHLEAAYQVELGHGSLMDPAAWLVDFAGDFDEWLDADPYRRDDLERMTGRTGADGYATGEELVTHAVGIAADQWLDTIATAAEPDGIPEDQDYTALDYAVHCIAAIQ